MFLQYLTNNFIMLYELIGMTIMLFISAHLSRRMKIFTRLTILLLFILSVVHHLELWSQSWQGKYIIRFLFTATKYSLYPMILIVLMEVFAPFIGKTKVKWRLLVLIPEMVSVPLYYTSQWSRWITFYTLGEDGYSHYNGGPLHFLPFVIFGIYLALFVVANIFYLKHYAHRIRAIVLYICVGAPLGVVLMMLFGNNDDYTPIFVSSLLLYFVFLYIHMANVDPLTGLMNRQSYYQDLRIHGERISAVVSVDMNDLKYLNDHFGHDAGDIAIKTVSDVLRRKMGARAMAYRIGGDEFIVLYSSTSQEQVEENIAAMREGMDETDYTCAFGYAMVEERGNIQQAVILSDERMYANKSEMKKAKAS